MKYRSIKKLYYSISEISEMLDIKQSVIRYWESEFKDLKPQKNRAGNRIYKKEDIGLIRLIDYYVHQKHLSIQEAAEMIRDLKSEGFYERKLREIMPEENAVSDTGNAEGDENGEKETAEAESAETVLEQEAEDAEQSVETGMYPEPQFEHAPEITENNKEDDFHGTEKPAEAEVKPLIFLAEEENPDEEALVFPAEAEKVEPASQPLTAEQVNDGIRHEALEKQLLLHQEAQKAMHELLTKISANIRDIIDILNEPRD